MTDLIASRESKFDSNLHVRVDLKVRLGGTHRFSSKWDIDEVFAAFDE